MSYPTTLSVVAMASCLIDLHSLPPVALILLLLALLKVSSLASPRLGWSALAGSLVMQYCG